MADFRCTLGSDGRTGLVNKPFMNYCYTNTFMQCMGHTDPLRQFILSTAKLDVFNFKSKGTEETAEKKKHLAVCGLGYTFHVLIRQMWSGKYSRLSVESLKESFIDYQKTHPGTSAANSNFAGTAQQDIEELITMMLEVLHETYSRVRSSIPLAGMPPGKEWEARITYHRQTHDSIIQDLFIFFVTEILVCSKCNQSRHGAFEPKGVLQVQLPSTQSGMKRVTLQECLANDFAETTTESVVCHHCREAYKTSKDWKKADYEAYKKEGKKDPEKKYKDVWKCDHKKKTVLVNLPPILIIHLRRFTFDGADKNQIAVHFPFRALDMSPYLNQEKLEDDKLKYTGSTLYDLYAVANQVNGSLTSGHYIAYAKPSDDFQDIGWRQFDDDRVSDIPDEDYIRKKALESSYILFYRRKEDQQTN